MRHSDIFSYQHILVAKTADQHVVGALLYMKKHVTYDVEVFNKMWRDLNLEPSRAHDATIEGYIKEIIKFDSDYYLLNLAVLQNYQGHGIAKALLIAFDKIVNEGSIKLEVISDNMNAVRLYQKHGYTITDEYKTFCLFDDKVRSYHMLKIVTRIEN